MKPILLSALLLLSVPAAAGSHFYAGAQERYSAQAGEIVTPDTGEVHRAAPLGSCAAWNHHVSQGEIRIPPWLARWFGSEVSFAPGAAYLGLLVAQATATSGHSVNQVAVRFDAACRQAPSMPLGDVPLR